MEMPPNRIEALRSSQELSRAELAVLCEVGEVTISRWERGETAIPDQQKFKLADRFSTSVEHLMGWDAEATRSDSPTSQVAS